MRFENGTGTETYRGGEGSFGREKVISFRHEPHVDLQITPSWNQKGECKKRCLVHETAWKLADCETPKIRPI